MYNIIYTCLFCITFRAMINLFKKLISKNEELNFGTRCKEIQVSVIFLLFLCVCFRAEPAAYGGSQARGQIGAVAAGQCHINTKFKCLRPTPQLSATPDP